MASFASRRLLANRLFSPPVSLTRRTFSSSIPSKNKFDAHVTTYIGNPRSVLAGLSSLIRFGATAYVIQIYICNTTLVRPPRLDLLILASFPQSSLSS